MAVLATQAAPDGGGLSPTFTAAGAGGDRFIPAAKTAMLIKNGSGASITATFTTPGTVSGLAIADAAVPVAAGVTAVVPLTPGLYTASDGLGDVAYSAVTTVTVAVVVLP
jgi:hypothetical protein